MTERRLQWILAGTAAVLALYWFHLAWAPSAAMETDWRAPPVTYADAAPVVEPPATPAMWKFSSPPFHGPRMALLSKLFWS
jgi:hypothetical protein